MAIQHDGTWPRLAPSLCISYSTKSDIHVIIMNPPMILLSDEIQFFLSAPNSGKKTFSSHTIPTTTGLEESLDSAISLPEGHL